MSEPIFGVLAPSYWGKDLRVIPIEPNSKKPAKELKGWQGHLAALPNDATRQHWLERYPNAGIGLLLGSVVVPGYVLVGLDVDDDRLLRLVRAMLRKGLADKPPTIAGKRGKKGATFFVLVPSEDGLKSTVLKGGGGLGNIDVLAAGKMTVMPPTLHPDTERPYEPIGPELLGMEMQDLPVASARTIALIGKAIKSEHAATLMTGEATHEAGVALTAVLVAAGGEDDEIVTIFKGLLPEGYNGNSLDELPGWIESARAKGFDQGGGGARASLTALVVALALNSGIELFHDGDATGYATIVNDSGATTHRIRSSHVERWLRGLVYRAIGKSPGAGPLAEAVATLETIAFQDGLRHEIFRRVAGDLKGVEIDLGRTDGRIVRIDGTGWSVEPWPQSTFIRGSGFGELPVPTAGEDLLALQRLLGLDDQRFRLLVAFLVNALNPRGPYLILLVEGEQGSGKSFFCEVIKRIIDPNVAMRLRLPDNDRDLMIQAKEYWLPSFDNASGVRAEMSDVLCTLATGGGIAVRRLYTDGELNVMSFARAFILNGIGGYAQRPDLMERAIPIKLGPMPIDGRRTEAEMIAEFNGILPGVLGALYDAVSAGLKNYAAIDPPRHIRMADAARWIATAEPALRFEGGSLIDAISTAQRELAIDRINDDSLAIKLRAITAGKPFDGYVGELFLELDAGQDSNLPRSPARLSNQLERLRPSLALIGISVEFRARDRGGRPVRITSKPETTGKSVRFDP